MTGTQQNSMIALALGALLITTGCVHTQVNRTGRMRLGGGHEGLVPVLDSVDLASHEKVAVIKVFATAVKTEKRRVRHLRRKASLLGCTALIALRHVSDSVSEATCIRRRDPLIAQAPKMIRVVAAPHELVARATAAGPVGYALLRVLDQVSDRQGAARAWPLEWYLQKYPNSPFRSDVEALFVARRHGGRASSTVRTAPQAPVR